MTDKLGVSRRGACRSVGQVRSTQWRKLKLSDDEHALISVIVDLAQRYGRYGYLRITALLRAQGWHVNHKRVARIWRREVLMVPAMDTISDTVRISGETGPLSVRGPVR